MIKAADLKLGDSLRGERIRRGGKREGVSYAQCSKLRGNDYSKMPIAFRGVSEESYAAWLAGTRNNAATDPATGHFAADDAATAERP